MEIIDQINEKKIIRIVMSRKDLDKDLYMSCTCIPIGIIFLILGLAIFLQNIIGFFLFIAAILIIFIPIYDYNSHYAFQIDYKNKILEKINKDLFGIHINKYQLNQIESIILLDKGEEEIWWECRIQLKNKSSIFLLYLHSDEKASKFCMLLTELIFKNLNGTQELNDLNIVIK